LIKDILKAQLNKPQQLSVSTKRSPQGGSIIEAISLAALKKLMGCINRGYYLKQELKDFYISHPPCRNINQQLLFDEKSKNLRNLYL
jgi:hypothetical protein